MVLLLLGALMFSLVSCDEEMPRAEKFSIIFIVDGKEYTSVATTGGEKVSIPISPSKSYYTFEGWYRDKGVWNNRFTASSLVNEPLSSDIFVYARFDPVEYTATFKDGDNVVAEIPFTVETKSITPPAIPKHLGYIGEWESYTLGTEDIVINAVYTAIPSNIT